MWYTQLPCVKLRYSFRSYLSDELSPSHPWQEVRRGASPCDSIPPPILSLKWRCRREAVWPLGRPTRDLGLARLPVTLFSSHSPSQTLHAGASLLCPLSLTTHGSSGFLTPNSPSFSFCTHVDASFFFTFLQQILSSHL